MEFLGIKQIISGEKMRNSQSRRLLNDKKLDYFNPLPIVPGIWGDRIAGLAHHLPAHIDDHFSSPLRSICREKRTGPIPNEGRESTEPLASNTAPPPTNQVPIGPGYSSQRPHWPRCFGVHPLNRVVSDAEKNWKNFLERFKF